MNILSTFQQGNHCNHCYQCVIRTYNAKLLLINENKQHITDKTNFHQESCSYVIWVNRLCWWWNFFRGLTVLSHAAVTVRLCLSPCSKEILWSATRGLPLLFALSICLYSLLEVLWWWCIDVFNTDYMTICCFNSWSGCSTI